MAALRWISLVAFACACGSSDDGPFDELSLDGTFTVGLDARVDVARDRYGVAHIRGKNLRDVAFVQGYVMAHDRLPQMDILRRYGAGTVAELFGALDPRVIDTDLEMRLHRLRPLAQQSYDELAASTDEVDRDIVAMLDRFADGVNAYAADVVAGTWELDPNILVAFDPERFAPWSPVDSLVLGRFQSLSLSFTLPTELALTDLYQRARAQLGDAIAADLLTFKPVGLTPTIDAFPNVGTDRGTTSDGYPADTAPTSPPSPPGLAAAAAAARPEVPHDVLSAARTAFASTIRTGPLGALGPHAFMQPYAGSNNWAIGPELTRDGSAILATDQHLQLTNPSIFYPTHITVDDEDGVAEPSEVDVLGVTFPGIPGVILGSNGQLAWSGTVAYHDVNDAYLETLTPCAGGTGACVRFNGQPVPIETFDEEIRVGALGTITSSFTATYERVPHHGPVLPQIDRVAHRIVPRPAARPPISVRYTGYAPTFEIRALFRLTRAANVTEGFRALSDFSFGAQNWTMVDSAQQIAWTTHAAVPLRAAAAHQWNAKTSPGAAAPFFVLSGEGAHEWEGRMSTRHVPHALAPVPASAGTQPYLATANADPVGATFDNDPLNGPLVDGRPLYAGVAYAAGVRQERIVAGIVDAGTTITAGAMARLQHDTFSTMGAKLTPRLLAALAYVGAPTGAPADAVAYLAALAPADRDRLIAARTLLAGWQFATPVAQDAAGSSAATALFNAWMHFFLAALVDDELEALGSDVWNLGDTQLARIAHEALSPTTILSKSASTGQAKLCDRQTPGPDDSCTKLALEAALAAVAHLESAAGFGTADATRWVWGDVHRLTIQPLFPNPALNLPAPGETPLPGFAKAGDNFNVNRSDMGWSNLDFSQFADGPAQRFIAIAVPGAPIAVRWQIPGGAIYDSRSSHYRDLLDRHYLAESHFDAPFAVPQIVADGEHRWEFR